MSSGGEKFIGQIAFSGGKLAEPVLKIKKSVYHGNINFHSDFSRSILLCLRPFLKKPSTTLAHWPGGSKPDGLFAMRRRYSTSSTPSASRVNRTTRSAPPASTAAAVSTPPPPLRPISLRWARNGARWGSGEGIVYIDPTFTLQRTF